MHEDFKLISPFYKCPSKLFSTRHFDVNLDGLHGAWIHNNWFKIVLLIVMLNDYLIIINNYILFKE